jgi:MFS family permease
MLTLMIFTLACGFATSSNQLIVFRVFAGFGGSVPFALAAPIIGDVYDAHNRGSALAWCLALEMAGPAVSDSPCTSGYPG